jgi:hypothetical protein
MASGYREGLTPLKGFPVFCFHVVDHVAPGSFLLGESGAGDADGGKGGDDNNQSAHE